ncbi:hypothetical protein N7448_004102 [Penicillium atrosanguineum]|uniref:Uncharacterized protein n=1 Tax=Penicillium atrosanguineum TaxID=1132637 RepID=A0A9W9U4D0_9EURO|nr:uncharacterized protein N7443_003066 [Penicillium atrosanguineum]KAJ5117157.1 hypothetical protein N7526_011266 [Penicillium atrosanguineum]KAJ5140694.1 hypothetical protein N7448_004102 [Penicillium atrosanguineum]KAJ5310605.1 hypothetical protein N7443_003066 [Penicillium atrosanguineum]KAJ5316127.1 hypothetical protein N7476_006434 [Penicillium atrosanguineum]
MNGSTVFTFDMSRKSNVIKSDWYQTVRDSAGGFESTFTAREKNRHAIKRRLLSHAFSEKALKNYEPRICNLIDSWIECLGAEAEKDDGCVDLGEWCNYLIFDILGDLGYGQSFELTAKKENRSIVGLVPKATAGWTSLGYHPFTKILRWIIFKTRLGSILGGQSFHDNARFRDFCLQKLEARRQAWTQDTSNEKRSTDMFEYLLNGRDPETGQSYTIGDLACESVLLMVAGSQSTSGALSATFFYLAHHPSALSKSRHEIHNTFPHPSTIHYTHGNPLVTLPYLRACIDESLRLSPPTPGHLPREIVGEGLVIDGCTFPPGTNVGVSPYAIHRTGVFRDPFAFVPERWLDGEHTLGTAFHPFSAGATGCPGRQLAIMELSLTVARLLWKFDLSVVGGTGTGIGDVEYRMRDFFVGEGVGPKLQLVLCPP